MVSLSENLYRTLGLVLFVSFAFPLGLVVLIFELVGIGDFIFPIILPIFGITAVIVVAVFGCILALAKVSMSTVRSQQSHASLFQDSKKPHLRTYTLPVNCSHCGTELRLSQVEWRDDHTIVCPSCFTDVSVFQTD